MVFFQLSEEEKDEYTCKRISLKDIERSEKANKLKALYFDFETTGLDFEKDDVTELAMVPFGIDENFQISEVFYTMSYQSFNEPKTPITEEITKITGITQEMVAGHKIDWDYVSRQMKEADIIIAHNVEFDYRFLKKYIDTKDMLFACSKNDIDWGHCFNNKLESLCISHGGFYDAHRSITDCVSGIWLLSHHLGSKNYNLPGVSENYLKQLYDNSRKSKFVIEVKIDFKENHIAKSNGFKWNPDKKIWFYASTNKDEANEKFTAVKAYHPTTKTLTWRQRFEI